MVSKSFEGEFKRIEIGQIPKGWHFKKLQELAKVTGGKRLPKGNSLSQNDTGHPYIRVSDMEKRGISLQNLMYVPADVVEAIKRYRVEEGDLYISVAGTLGLVGEVPKELDGANLTENADRISEIQCDTKYLLYVLKSELVQKAIKKEQTSNAQPKLALTRIKDFLIPIPPQFEQQKIAYILSCVDEAIEKTEAIVEQTEKVKKGLMQQLLTKGIGHTRFKNTEIGEIPEEWSAEKLENIAKVIDCKHYTPQYCEAGIPIVRTNNLTPTDLVLDNSYYTSEEDYFKLTDKYAPKKGDIVYGREGSFGVASYVNSDKRFSIGQRVVVISPLEVSGRFLHFSLNADIVFRQVLLASLGTTVKRINVSDIKKLLIPVPPREEQEKIVNAILPLFQRIENERIYLDALNRTKKGLMQSLLTGRVRIKVDEAEVTQV